MKTSQAGIITKRNIDSNIRDKQHRFMIQAGMIHMSGSGLYSWLPLGFKALKKLMKLIEHEMEKIGSLAISMPHLLPEDLLQRSGRLEKFGQDIFRLQDRHNSPLYCAPTHEEPIVDIASIYIKSYKDLPLIVYQIQSKLRDELRPRGGLVRAREFMMKDAYSFHHNETSLDDTYQAMMKAYCNIFDHLGLPFYIVEADPGNIFGDITHEFHIESSIGEDILYISEKGLYAANIEVAEYLREDTKTVSLDIQKNSHMVLHSSQEISQIFDSLQQEHIIVYIIKPILGELVAIALCSNHTLNPHKIKKHLGEFHILNREEISQTLGIPVDAILGPIGLNIPLLVDYTASQKNNFICGSNTQDNYYINVNWYIDVPIDKILDIRYVVTGDLSPDGSPLLPKQGVEVAHLFQLRDYYSSKMNVVFTDEQGRKQPILMGCYGIGVSRLLAVALERLSDEKGLIWPKKIAPYTLIIIPINFHKNKDVEERALRIYDISVQEGIDSILDDRKLSPGVLLKDAELIGYPYQIIVSNKQNCDFSFKDRLSNQEIDCSFLELEILLSKIKQEVS